MLEATESAAAWRWPADFGHLEVKRLRATLRLVPEEDGAIMVRGRIEAAVVQDCVVTLEPVPQRVAKDIVFRLLPTGREPSGRAGRAGRDRDQHGIAELGEAVAENSRWRSTPSAGPGGGVAARGDGRVRRGFRRARGAASQGIEEAARTRRCGRRMLAYGGAGAHSRPLPQNPAVCDKKGSAPWPFRRRRFRPPVAVCAGPTRRCRPRHMPSARIAASSSARTMSAAPCGHYDGREVIAADAVKGVVRT